MNIKDIKLRKERIDEYTVHHHFDEGTKHLPPVHAVKHYTYDIYDAEGNRYNFSKYDRLRTLKDVKEFIASYDDIEDARLAEEEKERVLLENERNNYRKLVEIGNDIMKKNVENPRSFKVGEMVDIKLPTFNKNSDIGDFLFEANLPMMNERGYKNWQIEKAKVFKVVNLSNEEYDDFIVNLMDNHDFIVAGAGGQGSDDPRLEGVDDMEILNNPEIRKIFTDTYYNEIHAVQAPNRESIAVNNEGYKYARYVGFFI